MSEPIGLGLRERDLPPVSTGTGFQRVYGTPVQVVGVTSTPPSRGRRLRAEHGSRPLLLSRNCVRLSKLLISALRLDSRTAGCPALRRGKHVMIEKPFTGYYGPGTPDFRGNAFSKEVHAAGGDGQLRPHPGTARGAGKRICYAENWVYAPAVQKEREFWRRRRPILWIIGDESHSGSHSPYYGIWKFSGGGALVGKGCHPLTAILYLKRAEGEARDRKPIRPATVSARTHEITRLKSFRDAGFLRATYEDIEDYCQVHITFEDGTVADVSLFRTRDGRGSQLAGGFCQQSPHAVQSDP